MIHYLYDYTTFLRDTYGIIDDFGNLVPVNRMTWPFIFPVLTNEQAT